MNKLYREVSVSERLPQTDGRYLVKSHGEWFSASYLEQFSFHEEMLDCSGVTHWLEEVNLEHIQDKRELTTTFLVNSIRLLDEQGARHLVKELCERFHLLPTKEEINKVRDSYSWSHINPIFNDGWRFGIKYILENLEGQKR